MKKKFNIPNIVTSIRIILLPFIFYFAFIQNKITFIILFILSLLTEVDGFIARLLKQETVFGAKFDSFADLLNRIALPFFVYLFYPGFVIKNFVLITILIAMFIVNIIVGYIKFNKLISLHLYSGKVAGILLYLTILYFLFFNIYQEMFTLVFIIVLIALTEEFCVIFKLKKYKVDIRSIFNL